MSKSYIASQHDVLEKIQQKIVEFRSKKDARKMQDYLCLKTNTNADDGSCEK